MEKQEFKVTALLCKLTSEKSRHRGRGERDTWGERDEEEGGGERGPVRSEEPGRPAGKWEVKQLQTSWPSLEDGAMGRASWRPLPGPEKLGFLWEATESGDPRQTDPTGTW